MKILTSSLLTPLGNTPETVACAVEAKINRFQEIDYIGSDGEPVIMAKIPDGALPLLPPQISRKYRTQPRKFRMLSLATGALQSLDIEHSDDEPLALFLSGPDSTIEGGQLDHEFLESLGVSCHVKFHECSRANNLGRAGIMEMVDLAKRYMTETNTSRAIIGTVDTYHDLTALQYLNRQNRLLPSSSDGCIPGEGAAFFLVSVQTATTGHPPQNTLSIGGSDLHHLENSEETLAAVLGKASLNSPSPVRTLYTCINGETRFASQLAIAISRHRQIFTEDYEIIRVAECLGDLGAASGGVMLALAHQRTKNAKENHNMLVCCISDNGTGAAMRLSYTPELKGALHDSHRICEQA